MKHNTWNIFDANEIQNSKTLHLLNCNTHDTTTESEYSMYRLHLLESIAWGYARWTSYDFTGHIDADNLSGMI